MGRGGGQVVSVLAFNSDDPSSNPNEAYSFAVKLCLKKTKKTQKEADVVTLLKKIFLYLYSPNPNWINFPFPWNVF